MTWLRGGRGPHVFGTPPGHDFVAELADGLTARFAGTPPDAIAGLTVLVPTSRMARRLTAALAALRPGFLPRIRLIDALALDPLVADLPPPVSQLRRRLELSRLVAAWLAQRGAPPASQLWDLTDALSDLLDRMQAEGVTPKALRQLDVSDESGHWQQALTFLTIAARWFDHADLPGTPARLRQAVTRLEKAWRGTPPNGPILVAGSTGSRAATAALIRAVAKRRDGAIVLPAFDFDLPDTVWARLDDPLTCEDHPQFRIGRLLDSLGLPPDAVTPWASPAPPVPRRAQVLSLALRPPPLTDAWMTEGPGIGPVEPAWDGVALIEAPTPRHEAEVIALGLKDAAARGRIAALVTPDRTLARRVTAALDRWGIRPDDSAGEPLSLSPPGRLLRQVARLLARPPNAEALLALLKHPLVHAGSGRARHLAWTQALEQVLRRDGMRRMGYGQAGEALRSQLDGHAIGSTAWRGWVADLTGSLTAIDDGPGPLGDRLSRLRETAETASRGATGQGTGLLWEERSGRAALSLLDRLGAEADAAGPMSARDFQTLLDHLLGHEIARDREDGHPQVLIRGLQEWRAEGADLVILGGLSDGIWPARSTPDPWLNRRMRHDLGLPLPEREIGLAAQDFWHAANAPEIWLTRALRGEDGPLAPARWLDRMENLLGGLRATGGPDSLAAMRRRGSAWLARTEALDIGPVLVPPAPRPSPVPPVAHRPRRLSVTEFDTLNRDPYAIYARRILRLKPLDPLSPDADFGDRGTILHKVVGPLADPSFDPSDPDAIATFLHRCGAALDTLCPWPALRHLWHGQIARVAPRLIAGEIERRRHLVRSVQEQTGQMTVRGVTITGRADRIDIGTDGTAWVYDYKSGRVPEGPRQKTDRQLQLLAGMVERGAFPTLGPTTVVGATYLSLSGSADDAEADFGENGPSATWAELDTVLETWEHPDKGYTAQSLPPTNTRRDRRPGDYDHLARHGEWDETTPPTPIRLP